MDENISTILYIIIGIVYFLYSILKKSKKQQPPQGGSPIPGEYDDLGKDRGENTDTSSRRPSFEDLLKEFTQEFEEKKTPKPAAPVYEEEAYETYETFPGYEEPPNTPETNRYQDHLNTKKEELEKALNQQIFKEPEEEVKVKSNGVARDIREMLKNPDGVRKAIIVSEILKPRYF